MTQVLNQGENDLFPGLLHDPAHLALAVLAERVRGLPREDRQDLFELVEVLFGAESREEVDSVVVAMHEILEQAPIRVRPLEQPATEGDPGPGLGRWLDWIGEKVRAFRKEAGLTQQALAERSGLPQSHISRIERRKLSPSRLTVEKIAVALGRPVADFDPSA